MLSANSKQLLREAASSRTRRVLRSDILASIEYEGAMLVFEKKMTEQGLDQALQEIDREVLSTIVDQARASFKELSQ